MYTYVFILKPADNITAEQQSYNVNFKSVIVFVFCVCAGEALDHLLKNMFTETAGARKGFPRVAVVITDGKSQDPVEGYAKRLKNAGVEIFTLGMWSFITAFFLGLDFFFIELGRFQEIHPHRRNP